jgi:hypothetical protein
VDIFSTKTQSRPRWLVLLKLKLRKRSGRKRRRRLRRNRAVGCALVPPLRVGRVCLGAPTGDLQMCLEEMEKVPLAEGCALVPRPRVVRVYLGAPNGVTWLKKKKRKVRL